MSNVVRISFLAQGPRVERPEPATVIPMRCSWRTLREMAKERRIDALALPGGPDHSWYWDFIAQAKELDAEADRLREIEKQVPEQREPTVILPGARFGRWTALAKESPRRWRCRCDCGQERSVLSWSLKSYESRSCGCLARELRSTKNRELATHGGSRRGARDPIYQIWLDMRQRCRNRNVACWSDYGGRGIKVCDRWGSFAAFREDMGPRPSPRHSIDRVDNDGDYEPSNCRWATSAEQQRNTRSSRIIRHNDARLNLTDWAHRASIAKSTLRSRLKKGWSMERALSESCERGATRAIRITLPSGETVTLRELATRLGVDRKTVQRRISVFGVAETVAGRRT